MFSVYPHSARAQCLLEVRPKIFDTFEPRAEPYEAICDADRRLARLDGEGLGAETVEIVDLCHGEGVGAPPPFIKSYAASMADSGREADG